MPNQYGTKAIKTERLLLRPFRLTDSKAMYTNWASDDKVTKYVTWPTYKSVADADTYLQCIVSHYSEADFYNWGICLKEEPDLVIGNISVNKQFYEIKAADIGYVLSRKYWNQGYMTEAVKAVINYLFTSENFNRIQASHAANNPGSGKVMQKSSMQYEGCLRQAVKNNTGICDKKVYAILADEYKQNK